jgi:L-Ala-D/L-Glu epimerase
MDRSETCPTENSSPFRYLDESIPVKIAALTVHHVRIPLRKPIRHASHSRTETDNVVLRCVLDDGTEGFGEGVPRDYVTGETIDSAVALLKRSDLSSQMEDCRDFPAAVTLIERLRLAPVPGDDRQCQGNAARCALELALLDAYGKAFGQPLSAVTQLLAPNLFSPRAWVRYSGAITSAKGWKLRIAAWLMRLYRFRQLKVKVGIAGYDDVARLKSLRKRVGSKMDLRIDANEAWTPAETAERIRVLEPFGISAVEQPVPHADVAALGAIRKQIHTPIMHDESLCSRVDAERAVADETCDLFNLRLSKCGGFIPSLRLAQFAKQHGLGYQLGCQVGETAILSAAGRHFAASVADIRYLEGSYDRHLVREALGTRDITFRWGGWAPAFVEPGLGVTVDPRALERVTLRKEQIL